MITIIEKPPQVRRFRVWDLEWKPRTYDLRICGVYDPLYGYTCYRSMYEFLRCEMIPSNAGIWYYAHFGGVSDLQFLIEEVSKTDEFSIRGIMKDSSIIKCSLRRGHSRWHFLDSGWLLRRPLKDIAKWMGMEKTGPKVPEGLTPEETEIWIEEWYRSIDFETLKAYNKNDCEVLWNAINRTQGTILELGGQMQATLPASGMQLFRRQYLTENIPTSERINVASRESYAASRVEVIQRIVDYPGLFLDINSSFPKSMTRALPGKAIRCCGRITDDIWDNYPFVAQCEVEVPDMQIPPLPYRFKGRVFFPTGKWKGWFTGVDLKLLLKEGGHFSKVTSVIVFDTFYDLKRYVDDLYLLRNKTGDGFEKEFYKLALNSLYGKFAEGNEKSTILINPSPRELQFLNRKSNMLFPGCFIKSNTVPVPHTHVPISSYVTAYSREMLLEYMEMVWEVHYCDTDGFSTTEELSTNVELGGLKIEKTFDAAQFEVPKFYRWQDREGTYHVKAKGFSLGKFSASESFTKLIEGAEVTLWRMARVKENLRAGTIQPRDIKVTKRLRQIDFLKGEFTNTSIGKRFMYPDGMTRPWSINELLSR